MSIKKFKKVDNKGREEIWQWDESPELSQAIKKLHNSGLKTPPPRPVDN